MTQNKTFFWFLFVLLLAAAAYGVWALPQLKFNLEIEQFFPEKDPDLEYFLEFKEQFEPDDNFLLIALYREEGVFDLEFMKEVREFSMKSRDIEQIKSVQSLPLLMSLQMTPFGPVPQQLVNLSSEEEFKSSTADLIGDPLYESYLFSKDQKSLVIVSKITEDIQYDDSQLLLSQMDSLVAEYDFEEIHFLGRPYFQREMVDFEKREILVSGAISLILVFIVLLIIFRQWMPILLSLFSIGISAQLLISFIIGTGSELNALAAMFPIIMVIVGTSDIVHLFTKFFDEVKSGKSRAESIQITIRHIGLATLMTSVTTAIGFLTLATSNIQSIKSFGFNAAAGVIIAYLATLLIAYLFLPMIPRRICERVGQINDAIQKPIMWSYFAGRQNIKKTMLLSIALLAFITLGVTKISGDYTLVETLPRNTAITEDFLFFEEHYGGFRPVEFAVTLNEPQDIWDPDVLRELNKFEQRLQEEKYLNRPSSINSYVLLANRIRTDSKALEFPSDSAALKSSIALARSFPPLFTESLVSKDRKKLRVSTNMVDVGAYEVKRLGAELDSWIETELDTTVIDIKRTGTSVLIDKNADFIRDNILYGLGLALLLVSVLMLILFRNWKMLLVSLVPNIIPLLFAGAMIGYLGIEIEAGISIVFAIIFGIAVDDSIHFLSKFKLESAKGKSLEQALETTFRETGKAIFITSIILFFGFLVLLFSNYPPSNSIGLLIGITLFSALLSDLFLIPLLLRLMRYESFYVRKYKR